jgi:KDEL-tailed cysteine endopeptidase
MVISAGMDISSVLFYQSGIYTGDCTTRIDHGVSLVGYGNQNGTLFWIIRNQFGPSWGEQGYIRLIRDLGKVPGKCGINMMPSYPTI